MRGFVLSYEGAASFEGGEEIVGLFDNEQEAMEHGNNISAFDEIFVREFDGVEVLRSWRKSVRYDGDEPVESDWIADDQPDKPYVFYKHEI